MKSDAAAIDSTQFQSNLDQATRSKEELEGRLAISEHRADVVAEIKRLAQKEALEAAMRLTDTTGITRKTSELAETYVTSFVRDRFTRESDRLRLERIELRKTGGQKGNLRHRPELSGGVRYTFPAVMADDVRALVGAEKQCCSFLDFAVREEGDRVAMTVMAPPDAAQALQFIFSP